MISFLKGIIEDCGENYLEVDVNGVGYEVIATTKAITNFSPETGIVKIPTYMQVREDAVTLYGFFDLNEKDMFLKLITVSGVGPKMAITILSNTTVEDLCVAITCNDPTSLSKVKGLGKKTAEKIILELKEKVGTLDISNIPLLNSNQISPISQDAINDACTVLGSLGISSAEALKLVNKVAKEGDDAETIVKRCLKEMAK